MRVVVFARFGYVPNHESVRLINLTNLRREISQNSITNCLLYEHTCTYTHMHVLSILWYVCRRNKISSHSY